MKNIILILLLSCVAFSCSKEDNNHEPKPDFPEHLIGKWKMVACEEHNGSLSMFDCDVQVTKNSYDIWFKADGTYFSKKTSYGCEEKCKYLVDIIEYSDGENDFRIIFNPDTECSSPCRSWAGILSINKNELTLVYAGVTSVQVSYTRVE